MGEEFKVIFSSKKNMANLRKLHRETYPPMLPYVGIFLQDLFQIEEGNTKRKKNGNINFSRLLRLTTVIDSILLYKNTPYKLRSDQRLHNILNTEIKLNMNLEEKAVWTLSDKVKSTDAKKK